MHRWQALIRTVAAAALLSVSTAVLAADETKGKDEVRRADPAWLPTIDCGEMSGWFKSQCANLGAAWTRGRPLVMLSGYTWHDPSTYDDDKLESFNSESWGGGFGFGRNDDKGDHYSWYTMAFKDSHYDWTRDGRLGVDDLLAGAMRLRGRSGLHGVPDVAVRHPQQRPVSRRSCRSRA